MNNRYLTLATTEDSPELLKGCLWALGTLSVVLLFLMLSLLAVQGGRRILDEQARASAEQERDAAYAERDTDVRNLNAQLANAQTAQATSESKLEATLAANAQYEEELKSVKSQIEESRREPSALQIVPSGVGGAVDSQPAPSFTEIPAPTANPVISAATPPSPDEVLNFVRGHLARMMGPVSGELGDYAEQVDFHDKPYASLQTIANDRERWAQKWPRRFIQLCGGMPHLSFNTDASVTISFDWAWKMWARNGKMVNGVYRDTWKVIPTEQGLRIIAEHSVDPSTGRSRD
jgi:hypothetical protein